MARPPHILPPVVSNPSARDAIERVTPGPRASLCPTFIWRPPVSAFDDIVSIVVGQGEDSKTFQCHKGLLGFASEVFARTFSNPSFTEAQTGTATFQHDDPKIFELFYRYMYTGRLFETMQKPTSSTVVFKYCDTNKPLKLCLSQDLEVHPVRAYGPHAIPLHFDELFRLYIFAVSRIAPEIQDVVVSLTFEKICIEGKVPVDLIPYLVENTTDEPEPDELVHMLRAMIAVFADASEVTEYCEEMPQRFLAMLYESKSWMAGPEQRKETKSCICWAHKHALPRKRGDEDTALQGGSGGY
ncbi:hypothetical protein BU26DRAFT_55726 [Trematosphaeria pertusa]|uniref:BTB domain-containing protein n=1 Tax=Trematosphaeria pertusa TaxID=390896 RepID=A0A6A6IAI2_9PLEO|nr:uncharacterized protein BU26DRAFT_55726 [Trematosphaeria pertusa]KAF2246932.1 hypothetical protein BU26DRAFT_55726 [Trematosphaeria pertusa]